MSRKRITLVGVSVAAVSLGTWVYQNSSEQEDVRTSDVDAASKSSQGRAIRNEIVITPDKKSINRLNSGKAGINSLWEEENYDQAAETFAAWLEENPAAALQFFSEIAPPVEVYHFLPAVTDYLATLPPAEAATLGKSLSTMNPDIYFAAIRESLLQWNDVDRSALLVWIQDEKNPGVAAMVGQSEILGSNSEALSEVIEVFSEGEVKNQLASAILSDWLVKEPEAAVAYVNSAPETEAFDRAAIRYIDQIVGEDHDAAHSWASMIVSPNLRESVLQELAENHTTNCEHCQLALEDQKSSVE